MFVAKSLQEYIPISLLGQGATGEVILVRKKTDQTLYALKTIQKKELDQKQISKLDREKQILLGNDHPFLIKCHQICQTDTHMHFILEYCPGGQIYNLIVKEKRFSQQRVKFYAAQIILAMRNLHQRGIIYQDLKPQNVMVCKDGYLKLIDFDLSVFLNNLNDEDGRVGGTPQYMAPQLIQDKKNSYAADWWSLGCMIYQLCYGMPPFYCKNRSQLNNRILNNQPKYPTKWSEQLKNLLNLLLQKDHETRLKNIQNIEKHEWFLQINWQKIIQKQVEPLYKPQLKNELDLCHFDRQFTECSIEYDFFSICDSKKEDQQNSKEDENAKNTQIIQDQQKKIDWKTIASYYLSEILDF